MRGARVVTVAVLLVACAASPTAPALRWTRTVTVRDPRALSVETCFDGAAPARMEALASYEPTWRARHRDGSERVHRGVEIPSEVRCVTQTLALDEAPARDAPATLRHRGWWWRATPDDDRLTVQTRFELPPGWSVSSPWARDGEVFHVDASTMAWEGYTLLGPLRRTEHTVGATVLDVTRVGFRDDDTLDAARWLGDAMRAAQTLAPTVVLPRVQAILHATARGSDTVHFGLASRGGGPSVLFLVDPSMTTAGMEREWQATHEFVHLFHPVFDDRDAWLREGIATYYQEVLRARTGRQTAAQAWASLLAGLDETCDDGNGATLAEESAAMAHTRRYRRVYWWGVAWVLTLDVATREATGNARGFDDGLRALCEAGARETLRVWRARDAAAVFDRAAGVDVWGPRLDGALAGTAFPDVDAVFARLGVRRDRAGAVVLDDRAPLRALRDAIMHGD